jgi:hypothetical protein
MKLDELIEREFTPSDVRASQGDLEMVVPEGTEEPTCT